MVMKKDASSDLALTSSVACLKADDVDGPPAEQPVRATRAEITTQTLVLSFIAVDFMWNFTEIILDGT